MRVEILIKRMSMKGVPVGSRRQVTAALEGELTRLLGRHGVPEALARDTHLHTVKSTPVSLSTGPDADADIGRGLARRVYRALALGPPPAPGAVSATHAPAKTS